MTNQPLVGNAVGGVAPGLEGGGGFRGQCLEHWQSSAFFWFGNFCIDGSVVKPGCRGLVAGGGVVDRFKASPEDGGQAQRAGLAAGVDLAARQAKVLAGLAGGSDGDHFGVRGGVPIGGDSVGAAGDDAIFTNNHRAEGAAAAGGHIFLGQANRFAEKLGGLGSSGHGNASGREG